MHRLAFLGPPGAGKGTQAATLARELVVPHLSTGDLLRAAVAARTPLGTAAEEHMRAGRLVPDELVLGLLRERLARPDAAGGYLLDGFPRTIAQAEALDALAPPERVVAFDIPETLLVDRLTQRRSCPACGAAYNLLTQPPRTPGVCDRDATPLVQRPDDRPEAVRTRLRVYREETAPLLEWYRRSGRLRSLDAAGDVPRVAARLRAAVAGAPTEGL